MARLKCVGFLFLAVPFVTSGCKDQEVRDYIKDELHPWNEEVVSQAVKALCDLEVLLRKGIEQPDGSWQPWFDHPPVPDGGWPFKWCSDEAGTGDPPAPPEPPLEWGT
jgi:hypothetical protein